MWHRWGLKMYGDVGIAEQQKQETNSDDGIKQFGTILRIFPHNTCIMRKVCKVLYTILVFLLFAVLLSLHLHTFLMFFTLVYLIFVAAYFIPHTVHNLEFKVALRMRTYEVNGITHEAIVIDWAVTSALWDFKVVKKQWGHALLSVKCCCFVQTPSWGCQPNLN